MTAASTDTYNVSYVNTSTISSNLTNDYQSGNEGRFDLEKGGIVVVGIVISILLLLFLAIVIFFVFLYTRRLDPTRVETDNDLQSSSSISFEDMSSET